MPSTHLSLNYHILFSTKNRERWIHPEWEPRLHAFLGGCVNQIGGVAMEINGIEDHIHLVIGLKATHSIADVLRDIRAGSSKWVRNEIALRTFGWQDGYAVYSVSASQLDIIRNYVRKQKEHHKKYSFQQEYLKLLKVSGVKYDPKYLW
jgi:REP element-mobilizing transposase RayT